MTREEAIKDIKENILPIVGGKSLQMAIKALEQPEIIRCKDCRYNAGLSASIREFYDCEYHEHIVSADDFCSDAERREE